MKRVKLNLKTVFLGVIALMLTILVCMVGSGFVIVSNMSRGEIIVEQVGSEGEDITFIIED